MRADAGDTSSAPIMGRSRSHACAWFRARLPFVSPIEAISALQTVGEPEAAKQEPGWFVREYPNLPSDSRGGRRSKDKEGSPGPRSDPEPRHRLGKDEVYRPATDGSMHIVAAHTNWRSVM